MNMPEEEKKILNRREQNAEQQSESYDTPVAYGPNGQPLYARPLQQAQPGPQFVHLSRAVDPVKPQITPEVQQKHDQSSRRYPFLNLSDQEYIVAEVRRHSVGTLIPMAVTAVLVAFIIALLAIYPMIVGSAQNTALRLTAPKFGDVLLIGVLLIMLFCIGGYIAVWVYLKNKFFLTNESVIQEIQTSLFSHDEQTVSLANIEDVSYEQKGIIRTLLNYGAIRLSTEGDETTYRFDYVARPKDQAAILNNAVEAFKNGRPVDQDED